MWAVITEAYYSCVIGLSPHLLHGNLFVFPYPEKAPRAAHFYTLQLDSPVLEMYCVWFFIPPGGNPVFNLLLITAPSKTICLALN